MPRVTRQPLRQLSGYFDDLPANDAEAIEYVKARLAGLPSATLSAVRDSLSRRWWPLPGPQQQAYESQADQLFYGGQAGGGKTDLLIGLAGTAHRRSIIFRREYPQLEGIIERGKVVFGNEAFVGGPPPFWRWGSLQKIELAAVAREDDVEKYQGRPHDLIAFDELTHFSEREYRYLIAWNRTERADQRSRVVATGNPPLHEEGEWVIRYWGPWLDPDHPDYPEEPGKLRWYVVDEDGSDREVAGPEPVEIAGEMVRPLSRTFIPASVDDNPFYVESGYKSRLQALPEPLRSQLLRGRFDTARERVIGQAYSSFSQENVVPVEYDPVRPVFFSLDFNVVPSVGLFAHELESGEYPEGNDLEGLRHLGIFGIIFNTEGCDVESLALAILNGEMPDGSSVPGWYLPDNFKGLMPHQNRAYPYGDASGRQKKAEAHRGMSAWAQVMNVLGPAMGVRFMSLQVPKANPPVMSAVLAVNRKLWNPILGVRSLWIDPRCKPLITDMERVKLKPDGSGIEKVTNQSDPRSRLTHISDALRYLVHARYPPGAAMEAQAGGKRYIDTQDLFEDRPVGNLAGTYR